MHAGRTGVSIYRTLGMPELIAPDRDAYVRIAAGLAQDADRRAELRRTLRQRAAASALCDGPGFAGRVDAALRRMWHERGGAAG
jgi:predicted O-linked N-acetylglucosamine transferase (SPINDLY family)